MILASWIWGDKRCPIGLLNLNENVQLGAILAPSTLAIWLAPAGFAGKSQVITVYLFRSGNVLASDNPQLNSNIYP